ncbi:hypothetical protein [Clostridium botulinum]|uniref:hypothetical protein n=1 Tax=Clostridium botulinum TaxID=1491 RepID=UPI00051921FF|nr:hypothetical protein [Clostridium botulinum]
MKKIIDFTTYSQNKRTQIESYSLLDMILDSNKRKEIYNYYDRNYRSTTEEDDICNEMRGKYKKDDGVKK